MRKIATDSIATECIAAADVTGPSGNVLVGKGMSITPALGRRLRNWGIASVCIEGEEDSGESVKSAMRSPLEIKGELYDKFLGTLDNTRMRRIFDAMCKHKLQNYQEEGA